VRPDRLDGRRKPYTAGLGLESVGLAPDAKGFLAVDRRMRTKVANVYAIGDVAGQPMLAHKGSREGLVRRRRDRRAEGRVRRALRAGRDLHGARDGLGRLTEEQCRERKLEWKTGSFPFAASGRAMSLMETRAS